MRRFPLSSVLPALPESVVPAPSTSCGPGGSGAGTAQTRRTVQRAGGNRATARKSTRRGAGVAVAAACLVMLAACSSSGAAQAGPDPTRPSASASVPSVVTDAPPAPSAPAVVPSVPAPAPVAPGEPTDPLTGLAPSANPVIAVKIDNTYFSVAQFGISKADVVFVEQVEGGLTRLIAVFHSDLDQEVGPVRSVRTTDAELLPVFGKPALVFSGGAPAVLKTLHGTDVVDTSGLSSAYFRSDAASGTYNLHAKLAKVSSGASGLGPVQPIGLTFTATDARVAAGASATSISVIMQSGRTDFRYTDGAYRRLISGTPATDHQGDPETADNVLVMHVTDSPDGNYDSVGSPSYLSHTVGSGSVTLSRDGHSVEGTWSRGSASEPFQFLDANGQPLPFKAGHTWIILAPQSASTTLS